MKKRARLAFAAVIALGALWAFVIEPSRLVVRRVALSIPTLPPLKIAVLSDLHAGAHFIDEAKITRVVDELNALDADLILLLGDYLNNGANPVEKTRPLKGGYLPPEVVMPLLAQLHARHGVYAVLGNHDWWLDGERITKLLQAQKLTVLEDRALRLDVRGRAFYLVGFADSSTQDPHIQRALAPIPADAPIVAFTHNPDLFPEIPARVGLTIAGHTHGGQVALPFIGRPILPILHKQYAYGHVVEGGRELFVTSGVGTSLMPVRFGVPPEIVLLLVNDSGG